MIEISRKRSGLFESYDEVDVVIEHLRSPHIEENFRKLGFNFTRTIRNLKIIDKKNDIFISIPFTLDDWDIVMLVDIKTRPTSEDIVEHVRTADQWVYE